MNSKVTSKHIFALLFISLFVLSISSNLLAQKVNADFNSERWNKSRAKVLEHLGREALMGAAFLNDVELQNGIIEVDIATKEKSRSYPGVLFRVQDQSNYERIYIRPHRSPFYDDALQYAPTFNGVDSWQLYNGPGETSSIDIPSEQWNHLKIVFSGNQARVFWNDDVEPVLIIPQLEFGESKGSIGLSGPMNGTAYYSNFSYEIKDDLTLPTAVPAEPVCGIIKDWQISNQFPYVGSDFTKYPNSELLSNLNWQSVQANDKGIVDVSRYHSRKSGAADCIFAKTTISVGKDTLMRFGFGYSDFLTVYLNKQPIFLGVSSYQSRDKSFLGIVGYFDNLFLPLKKGNNELMIQVGEYMGGWGFCFRNEDAVFIDESLEKVWEQSQNINLPEAVIYDPNTNAIYVSNYFNEGNEYLSKLSTEGNIIESEWISGLRMPTGMTLYNDNLYVVDRTSLNIIDTEKGVVIEKIPLEGVRGPNDLTAAEDGTIYISDMPGNAIYKYAHGQLEKWLENLESPNAMYVEGDNLFIGVDGKVLQANLIDKSVNTFAQFEQSALIDGIQSDGKGNYFISDYNGKVYSVDSNGKRKMIMDTSTKGTQSADFLYIPDKQLLVIPTFLSNSIEAYKLNK